MKRNFFALIAVAALLACAVFPAAQAATPNYPPGAQVVVIPIQIDGQRTASVTAVTKFTLPFKAKLIGVSATARASGGTTPTLTVDLLKAAVSVLSAPISITAGTVAEGTITVSALADESAMTINLAITGTTPTWDDITVLITVVRN